MVMKPEPVFEAVETVKSQAEDMAGKKPAIILLTPQGRIFNQAMAGSLARNDWLMLICGHYEGLDERIREHLVTDEISIGDYVLTGGELAAMVVDGCGGEIDSGSPGFRRISCYMSRIPADCWSILSIPVLKYSGIGQYRIYYFQEIMLRLLNGEENKLYSGQLTAGRTCY